MSQPLFIAEVDPHQFFDKVAAIAKMPDDEKKWPAHVLSELYKQLPFLSKLDADIVLDRQEPEAGYAHGYASIMNRSIGSRASQTEKIGKPQNHLRIPIIIKERLLQPFHTFEVGGSVYPLTEDRIQQAMINPRMFDSVAPRTPVSPSLIDQLNPPFQQRQGFGLSGLGVDNISMGKISSAKDGFEEWLTSKTGVKKEASTPAPVFKKDKMEEKWEKRMALKYKVPFGQLEQDWLAGKKVPMEVAEGLDPRHQIMGGKVASTESVKKASTGRLRAILAEMGAK